MTKAEYMAEVINMLLRSANAELVYDRETDVIEVHVITNKREPNRATVVEF